ncbi:MAG: sulfotransferase family protein [Bacteroidia bacterium]
MNNPVFIGGLMKSGTSLLRKLVSLHPNIYGGLETHWFSNEFRNHWNDEEFSTRIKWLFEFYEISETEANQIRHKASSSEDFFGSFMTYCTKKSGKKRWVEKTPDNVFHLNEIFEYWENAKVIIMKRNFMDIFASWKRNNKGDVDSFIIKARHFLDVIDQYEDDNRVLFINYNELVTEPRRNLELILEFLDEPFIPGMEDYQGDSEDYSKVLNVTGKISATTESLSKPIFTTSIDSWKEVLSREEVKFINQLNV